jgi:hypothetical protein
VFSSQGVDLIDLKKQIPEKVSKINEKMNYFFQVHRSPFSPNIGSIRKNRKRGLSVSKLGNGTFYKTGISQNLFPTYKNTF